MMYNDVYFLSTYHHLLPSPSFPQPREKIGTICHTGKHEQIHSFCSVRCCAIRTYKYFNSGCRNAASSIDRIGFLDKDLER